MSTLLKLDEDLQGRMEAFAASHDRSPNTIMHEAITRYLTQEEARESFRGDAMNALAEYERTGLHLTLAEMEDWMNDWGNDRPMPECHV